VKAANFAIVQPKTLDDAIAIFQTHGDLAVPMAGGQSLLAAMNLRLARPEILVDITGIEAFRGIRLEGDDLVIGALTTHAEVLRSDLVAQHVPLLSAAAPHIAHVAIRNRGTIGGSLANADPAAELPTCILALGATIRVAGIGGRREVAAPEFFKGTYETALATGELIVEVAIPVRSSTQIMVFDELCRRHGDFALVSLAAVLDVHDKHIKAARLVYGGCADRPMAAARTGEMLVGCSLPLASLSGLAESLATDLEIFDSPGVRASTRLKMATTLTERRLGELM
jgi:carbon-monoxide dehydrogenase medium subunit